jgi:hypothetical protein
MQGFFSSRPSGPLISSKANRRLGSFDELNSIDLKNNGHLWNNSLHRGVERLFSCGRLLLEMDSTAERSGSDREPIVCKQSVLPWDGFG